MSSYESHFQLHHEDWQVRILQKQHESTDTKCIATALQVGGANVSLTYFGPFNLCS